MQFPLSWLKKFVPVDVPLEEFAEQLTLLGIEVDAIKQIGPPFRGVIAAEVLSVSPHPNADKLVVAEVDTGEGRLQVVCGAPNCRKGLRSALAQEGAVFMAEGKEFRVKKSTIRGVSSSGMLCSEAELGISSDHSQIIELPSSIPLGTDLGEMENEAIISVSLTPNFAHAQSLLGIAREWAAATGELLTMPQQEIVEGKQPVEKFVRGKIEDPIGCPRYCCRVIANVQVAPSPDWLKKSLESCGLRSVNNVVDVTNYVLLEQGYPLHAFDYDLIKDHSIVVRKAYEGEVMLTLDGEEHTLTQDVLLIADPEKSLAIAGVMGGKETEVSAKTTNVLLEGAYFNPHTIRLVGKHLNVQTEASKRFERGVDPQGIEAALDRAAELIRQLTGGEVAVGIFRMGEERIFSQPILFRFSQVERILGIHLSRGEVEEIFHRLGFSFQGDEEEKISVTVPSYRVDIREEIDLLEEIGRLHGYGNFPRTPRRYFGSTMLHDPGYLFERGVRDRCAGFGLQEWITCDLLSPSMTSLMKNSGGNREGALQVINPTSIEQSVLRTSLLPGMMSVVKHNLDHQNYDLHAFEIGRLHWQKGEEIVEPTVVGMIFCGRSHPHFWGEKGERVDFFMVKGLVEDLLVSYGIEGVHFASTEIAIFHPGRQASFFVDALELGSFGEIHPSLLRTLDIKQRIYFAEISLLDLQKVGRKERRMRGMSKYPSSERDWTVTLPKDIPVEQVFQAIRDIPSRLLEKLSLMDVYESEKIGPNRHNLTFHMVYRDPKKTISQEAVEAEHRRLIAQALEHLKQ